ncbi:MAG: B12-binding domain-containing radical SAM protein [Candidatus Omnitrophica bacterium]|nr:B12-binding domain-containing radical SAM protein [Candidatus Omnitrophota bacterium]MBU4478250.1 B12-binding domain-containing radical SAM protein [Candidatus Omnitrophota bacterium]MCG2703318.1 B12-binding domain-containing radical SAM protein [Candidatus Omnitrophota bacterium]
MIISSRDIKKILLIFPPVVFSSESPKQIMPPLGITYLGAFLRNDYDVRLLDAAVEGYNSERKIKGEFLCYGLSIEQIKNHISRFDPGAVGISCLYSSQFSVVAQICEAAKSVSKDIITVIGGTHPTFLPHECLNDQNIDFVVLGEGEKPFKLLMDSISSGDDFSLIDGIAFRDNEKVRINPRARLIEDIDSIPMPARDLLPLEKYFRIGLPMGLISRQSPAMNMITSRGCPFQCAFCSSCHFWGRTYRPRSVKGVLKEMEHLKSIGIRELKFFDDNLTLDSQRAKDIFRGMIEREFNFSWNTPNGIAAQTLDEEMVSLMKQSGCYELTLAVESGDEQILRDVLKKPTDLRQIVRTVKLIKDYGIDTYGFFMIGFPGESKAQIYRTLEFMDKIRLDRVSLFIANPLPGTEIYDYCKKKGYFKDNKDDTCFDYFKSKFQTEEFDGNFLENLRRKWYWTYNLKLILRNPFKFFSKYNMFIFKKPLFVLRTIFDKLVFPTLKLWIWKKKK